jgi:hypothetical protein
MQPSGSQQLFARHRRIELDTQMKPDGRPAAYLGCAVCACAIFLIAASAHAQRTEFRDPAGNPRGYIQQEGGRAVLRDNAGNPHGHWQQEGDWLVHRDNAGNLLDRQRTKPR